MLFEYYRIVGLVSFFKNVNVRPPLQTSTNKGALKRSANNQVLENIKNTFEMEMDNEIFKQNNADT